MNDFKKWATAAELARYKLPKMPHTEFRIREKADRENWASRPREIFSTGRTPNEYAISCLPAEAQEYWNLRHVANWLIEDPIGPPSEFRGKAEIKGDAKFFLVCAFETLRQRSGIAHSVAREILATGYNNRILDFPQWMYDCTPRVCGRSLTNWRKIKKDKGTIGLDDRRSMKKYHRRHALDVANDGDVSTTIAALITQNQHLTAPHIRDIIRHRYGETLQAFGKDVPLPSVRSFQIYIKFWKEKNHEIYMHETDRDGWKNKYMPAFGSATEGVERVNQVWEIDASPADLLCKDGRYNLYAVIDVFSRRTKVLVTTTTYAQAALTLMRDAILDWGIPENLKLDNGPDFKAGIFKRVMDDLEIDYSYCLAYTPEGKGLVERVIKTIQHDLMARLPGFVGHNVTDRKKIEAKKAFAKRKGLSDENAFCVDLTPEDLQNEINIWLDGIYHLRKHSTIGMSPMEKAQECTAITRRIGNERALDLLLAGTPDNSGLRKVTKSGIRLENATYISSDLEVGSTVLVRFDMKDMGRVFCFSPDGKDFICEALCPERSDMDRSEIASIAKAVKNKKIREGTAELKSEVRKITPAVIADGFRNEAQSRTENITVFPKQSITHNTDALDAAGKALGGYDGSMSAEQAEKLRCEAEALMNTSKEEEMTPEQIRQADLLAWQTRARKVMKAWHVGEDVELKDRRWILNVCDQYWFPEECEPPEDFELMRIVPKTPDITKT